MPPSIFFDFSLPNSTTWFYLSVILAVALFVRFNRFISVRNWDIVALFAMAPGLLLVQEGRELHRIVPSLDATSFKLRALPDAGGISVGLAGAIDAAARGRDAIAQRRIRLAYILLLSVSAYWLLRCMVDLELVRRPPLIPNLNPAGLTWLAVALFVSLGAVAITKQVPDELPLGSPNAVIKEAEARATALVKSTSGIEGAQVRWWVERSLAGTCHFAVVIGLVLVGKWHFGDIVSGIAAATAYLLLPYIAFHITQVQHVIPTAFLLWAVVFYRRPYVAGTLIGIAGGGFILPLLVAPVWAGFYKHRGMGRFLIAFTIAAGLSLALVGTILWLNESFTLRIPTTIELAQLKNWRAPDAEGFWTGIYWAYRIPVFCAALAFMTLTAFWPEPKNLAHVLALSSANLLTAQLWYAKNGGAYVLWYLPLLLLMVFRPNLSDTRPPEIKEELKVES